MNPSDRIPDSVASMLSERSEKRERLYRQSRVNAVLLEAEGKNAATIAEGLVKTAESSREIFDRIDPTREFDPAALPTECRDVRLKLLSMEPAPRSVAMSGRWMHEYAVFALTDEGRIRRLVFGLVGDSETPPYSTTLDCLTARPWERDGVNVDTRADELTTDPASFGAFNLEQIHARLHYLISDAKLSAPAQRARATR